MGRALAALVGRHWQPNEIESEDVTRVVTRRRHGASPMERKSLSEVQGRVENVPVRCVLEEDLPLTVDKSIRVLLDCGAGERLWSGAVVKEKKLASALQLALPEKRAAHQVDQVYLTVLV